MEGEEEDVKRGLVRDSVENLSCLGQIDRCVG